MKLSNLLVQLFITWIFLIPRAYGFQTYQKQVLLQLRKFLEYPVQLQVWETYYGDFCNMNSTEHMSIACQDNSVSELKIKGDKHFKVSGFDGFAVPNQTLSEGFSIDSFVTTLTRLHGLRVLSLVSLGIWGPLPDKIHRLNSLEVLDLSSNFLFGSVPPGISRLVNLHSLTLDSNFFNVTVPDWFDSLTNLTILSLKNNSFTGHFPSSVCKITTLTDISMSHNELSGKLPDMSTLSGLKLVDLRENRLDSGLPPLPVGLMTVLLSNNSFSGKIPEQFGKLHQLQHLDLSNNSLSGTIPIVLLSLPSISYLNLASNLLSGSFPNQLTCGHELGFVDISINRLEGTLPSCLDATSDDIIVRFGGNCLSVDTQHQNPVSYCEQSITENTEKKRPRVEEIGVLVGVITGAAIIIVLLAIGLLILFRKYYAQRTVNQHNLPKSVQDPSPTGISSELLANARIISQAAKLGIRAIPVCRSFSLEELKYATNNFDQSTFLGEGSIGKLYKGRLENGTHVVIRTMAFFRKHPIRNLQVRLGLLSKLHHPNLVSLLGHCIDGGGLVDSTASRVFLVYEYVPNGKFRSHLSESFPGKALKWSDRLAVLIDVAKAVHFLHTGVIASAFSNRLKTNNILLDEHRVAKLSDYGISLITEEIEKLEATGGSTKSWHMTRLEDDAYNFGFILLEALVGPIVSGKGEAFLLNEMASFGSQDGRQRIVDPIVLTTSSQESLSIVISITKRCVSPASSSRPSFEDILWNLQYAAQVQATSDLDQKSDATSVSLTLNDGA